MRELLVFLFLFFSLLSFGQTSELICSHSIVGRVLDAETKEPIPYVTVKVRDSNQYTSSGLNGGFSLDGLCKPNSTLIVSCFGYCDSVCEDYHETENSNDIFLTQKINALEDVTIQVQKSRAIGTKTISQLVLKKEDIRSNPTQSLAAAIADQQGVSVISTGSNVQLPVIHGLYGNRILILNNDLKHGFQNWGRDHAPEIDLNSVYNITIIKGAAGVRYGPEALGGALVLETNPLHLNQSLFLDLGTGYQTNGRGVFTNIDLGGGSEHWSYFANGNFTKIGDRNAPDYNGKYYNLKNSGKEEKSFGFGTRYHIDKWDFKVHYNYVNQNLGLLRASVAESFNSFKRAIESDYPRFAENPFSYEINEPNQLVQHHMAKFEASFKQSNGGEIRLIAGRQLNKRQEYDVRRNADRPIFDVDLVTSDYQLEWKHPTWNKFSGLLGFQYFNQNNDNNYGTGITAFIPNYNVYRYSLFFVENLRLREHMFEFGFRYDNELNSVRGREQSQAIFRDTYAADNITASLGYSKEVFDDSFIRLNVGTAWRLPNMAELYAFGQHEGFKSSYGLLRYYWDEDKGMYQNKVLESNSDTVKSEKGYKFSSEFEINSGKNSHFITVYSHYIENYIFERPIKVVVDFSGPLPAYIFEQADSFFMGFDYTWKRDWLENLSGTLGVNYLYSKNIEKNETLINQPPITLNYALNWNHSDFWKFDSSAITVKPSYTFKQFQAPRTISIDILETDPDFITPDSEIFDFKAAPDGYFLLDIAWDFQIKSFNASIAVHNVLNTRYRNYLNAMRYFADEPGRNILMTLKYSLNR